MMENGIGMQEVRDKEVASSEHSEQASPFTFSDLPTRITTPLSHTAPVAPAGVAVTGVSTVTATTQDQDIITLDIDGVRYSAHILEDNTVSIDTCETKREQVVFPDEIEGRPVTRLAPRLCKNAPNLTTVVFPKQTRELGEHAFDRCHNLAVVALSQTLESIGGFAFSNVSITEFDAPVHLRELGPKAFYHCDKLTSINLNDGLAAIGEGAFAGTRIHSLVIPGSVTKLGRELFKESPIANVQPFRALAFGKGSPFLVDTQGGLYRRATKGLVLLEMLSLVVFEYAVLPGTVRIADRAFLYHPTLTRLVLPEGLAVIGNASCKYCRRLRYVSIPDSLVSVGEEAFRSTRVESFRISAVFEYLGMCGLSTCSYGNSLSQPALQHVEIDPANMRFYLESGLLCRRDEDEGDHAIVYVGPDTEVVIPASVRYIDSFCFGGVSGIEHLSVHTEVFGVALGAFFVETVVPHVTVLTQDMDGSIRQYEAYFPSSSSYSVQCFSQAFGGRRSVGEGEENIISRGKSSDDIIRKDSTVMNPPTIFAFADLSIRHCYNMPERCACILLRLADGYFLDETSRDMFAKSLMRHLDEFIIQCSKQNNLRFIQMLIDLAFINENNMGDVINLLGAQNDVKSVSYLLNVQHERFASTQAVVEDL